MALSPVARMEVLRKWVGKYLVLRWLRLISATTSASMEWMMTVLVVFQQSRSAIAVPKTPAPATTIVW
jgi:hypothetical protein